MIAAIALSIVLLVPGGQAKHDARPCWEPWRAAYYQRGDVRPIKSMTRCWARLTHLSVKRSLSIAACESDFRPDTEYHGSAGVFQHGLRWWDDRLALYAPEWIGASPWNAWVNIGLAFRYAKVNGWSAWSCA